MAHPYKQHKNANKDRVSQLYGGATKGRSPKPADDGVEQFARGGKVKHGGKGHHTKINIVVAPKGNDAGPPLMPPPGGPPLGAGGPGGPPPPAMPPKTPMGPPPPPMGGGMPGMGGMKRGGGVKSGLSSPANLKKWADRASSNTRYAKGGKVLSPSTGGGDSGGGRLAKVKSYGKKARTKS